MFFRESSRPGATGPLQSFLLVQSSLRRGGFQLLQLGAGGRRFVSVNVAKLAAEQLAAVTEVLDTAATQLRERDRVHKRQFVDEKLRSIFDRLDHAISHLGAISDVDNRLMMPGFVSMIRNGMDSFRRALEARSEPFEADLHHSYRGLSRALRVLEDHVKQEPYADADLAEVAASHVYREVEHLKRYAQEVDDEYAEGADQPTE